MDLRGAVFPIAILVGIFGCTQKSDNPLLDATDGQFRSGVAPYFECLAGLEKGAKVFADAPKIKGEEEQGQRLCLEKAQKLMASTGITDNVTFAHIQDARVKDRYLALKAEPTK